MDLITQARNKILNGDLDTSEKMCAFDIVGKKYLDGEMCFMNHEDGLESLKDAYNLTWYELIGYILASKNYNIRDMFVTFDGEELMSHLDIDYIECMLLKYMDEECAEEIENGSYGLY